MAKKSRRIRKKGQQVRLSPAQMVQPMVGEEVAGASIVSAPARPASQAPNLQEEYHYVIADLKRIGVIAVAMLALMVILVLLLT